MNHYDWLNKNFLEFCKKVDPNLLTSSPYPLNLIDSHADKCRRYQSKWEDRKIPFEHGVAIFLLGYTKKFREECRDSSGSFKLDMADWVIEKYPEYRDFLI